MLEKTVFEIVKEREAMRELYRPEYERGEILPYQLIPCKAQGV